MLAAILAFTLLMPSFSARAQDLCAGKTPPAATACYSVGKCDPATGEFVLVDKTPSTAAPACTKYTGGCDAESGIFTTADIACPSGQQCLPSTGRCTPIDKCANWVAPQDADKCNIYTCDAKKGTTHFTTKTCDVGQFCTPRTGECKSICVDNDLSNKEEIPGQLVIKGVVSSTDRCTSDGKLEQVGCDAEGGAKVYTAKACSKGACINGICADLCTTVPANDLCTVYSCDAVTGNITQSPAAPPAMNACQSAGTCDAAKGYTVTNKTAPAPIDVCHAVGECNAKTGEFAQTALTCPEGQECSVQGGGCMTINKCKGWVSPPSDRCNYHSCDPVTGNVTKLPVQPPTITACQTVRACDIGVGYEVINKTCPTDQECSNRTGECIAIGSEPPAETITAETVAPVPVIPIPVAPIPAEPAPTVPAPVEPAPAPEPMSIMAALPEGAPAAIATPAPSVEIAAPAPPETPALTTDTQVAPSATPVDNALAATVPDTAEAAAPQDGPVQPPATPPAEEPELNATNTAVPETQAPIQVAEGSTETLTTTTESTPPVETPVAVVEPPKEMTECDLRARRICEIESEKQPTTNDIRLLSDFAIRDALAADSANPVALDDPAVQQTLKLVGENFTDPRYFTQYTRDDDPSRLAYCINRIKIICDLPEADRGFVIEDCSDPKYAAERANLCTLNPVQQAACTGPDSTLVPSTSSIFEVHPTLLSLSGIFTAEQVGNPLLLASSADPLQQYILIPKNVAETTATEVLAIDPRTGLVRMMSVDKGLLSVVKDANGTDSILMLTKPNGIAYLPNAWNAVAESMKAAVPIDKIAKSDVANMQPGDTSAWINVPLPADELILSALPNGKGVVIFTGNTNGTFRGIWIFASITDESGKFILIPDASKYTLRKAFIAFNGGKLSADLALKSSDASGVHLSVMHCDDILEETPLFTELLDQESGTKALKMAISEDWVHRATNKSSSSNNPKDKEVFAKSLIDAIFAGTVGIPAVTHTFADYGEESSTLVIQPNGVDLFKMGNNAVVKSDDEFLSSGTDGEVCRKTITAMAVDTNMWGGKDVVLLTDNGTGTVSLAFYPNANQPPLIKSLTAEWKTDGIQLGATSITEEGEASKCKWEAYQIIPDGVYPDMTSQLDNPNSCSPRFKTEIADATYLFRFTAIDPLGLTTSSQETIQVTQQIASPDSSTPLPPKVAIVNPETQSPPQGEPKEEIAKEEVARTEAPQTPELPTPPMPSETMHKSVSNPNTASAPEAPEEVSEPSHIPGAAAVGELLNCSLTRHTHSTPPPKMWYVLPLLFLIPLILRVIVITGDIGNGGRR